MSQQTQVKRIRGTLVIVSSLAPNMFYKDIEKREGGFGFLQHILFANEEELKQRLNEYERVVSFIRHPSTVQYLKTLRADIEIIEDQNAEYKIGMYDEHEEILTVALAKRPPKTGAVDVQIGGFNDLAIVLYRFPEMISF